jgi:hypothetical protein
VARSSTPAVYAPLVLEELADHVYKELTGDGYEPRYHEPDDGNTPVELRLRGEQFDINDFKSMVAVAERFGLGMKLDPNGWLTLH